MSRWGRAAASFFLSLCLHVGPAWFLLFGPQYGLPSVLELNLEAINFYRERIFRNPQPHGATSPGSMPLHVSVSMRAMPDTRKRVATPRREEDLVRARSVQKAIRSLWESMTVEQAGYALVSLNILEDGRIGEYVINRITGGEEFQTFLLSFLTTLKDSNGNLAGPGEPLWLECEFVVQPKVRKKS